MWYILLVGDAEKRELGEEVLQHDDGIPVYGPVPAGRGERFWDENELYWFARSWYDQLDLPAETCMLMEEECCAGPTSPAFNSDNDTRSYNTPPQLFCWVSRFDPPKQIVEAPTMRSAQKAAGYGWAMMQVDPDHYPYLPILLWAGHCSADLNSQGD